MNEEENTKEDIDEVEEEKTEETVAKPEKTEVDELNDRYKRLFAEFENYKKRTQKEAVTKRAEITGDVVMSILPIMDNLEKACNAQTEDTNYQEGIKIINRQLSEILARFGMTEIETVGHKFDPELHEAVSHIDDPEKGEGEIVEEFRKGYQIGNKVIRHAMVVVAN